MLNNILIFFYKYTLIVFRTTNINIYLEFQVFNTIFNYLNCIKKTITNYSCFLRKIILKVCKKASTKLAKYYSKIKDLSRILYNFVNILNSI